MGAIAGDGSHPAACPLGEGVATLGGYPLRGPSNAPAAPRATAEPAGVGAGAPRRVALLTLGCARNEVDSEELAARLTAGGWQVTTDGSTAEVVLVNTCGFVDKAKQD